MRTSKARSPKPPPKTQLAVDSRIHCNHLSPPLAIVTGMSPRAVLQAVMKFQGTFVKRANVREAVSNIAELARLLGERRRQGDEKRPTKKVTLLSLVCRTSFRKACSRFARRLRMLCGCCGSGPTLDVSQSVGFKAEDDDPLGQQHADGSNFRCREKRSACSSNRSAFRPLMHRMLDPLPVRRSCMGLCWREQATSGHHA